MGPYARGPPCPTCPCVKTALHILGIFQSYYYFFYNKGCSNDRLIKQASISQPNMTNACYSIYNYRYNQCLSLHVISCPFLFSITFLQSYYIYIFIIKDAIMTEIINQVSILQSNKNYAGYTIYNCRYKQGIR